MCPSDWSKHRAASHIPTGFAARGKKKRKDECRYANVPKGCYAHMKTSHLSKSNLSIYIWSSFLYFPILAENQHVTKMGYHKEQTYAGS